MSFWRPGGVRGPRGIWACKIGEAGELPNGSDAPMRRAVRIAFEDLAGHEPAFIFSGWGAELTDGERDVIRKPLKPGEIRLCRTRSYAVPGSGALLWRECYDHRAEHESAFEHKTVSAVEGGKE